MAGNRVVVQEGYEIPFAGFDGYRRRRKHHRKHRRSHRRGRRTAHQSKFGRAAKHCKGRSKGAFRACVKAFLRKH